MVVKKISELVPKGAPLGNTDLLVVGVDNGFDYDLKSVTGAELLGNVVSQTITNGVTTKAPSENVVYDSLDLKVDKVTGKGLSTEDYTSAEKTKLSALTGTNTGNQNLQQVTNLGNSTTHAIVSATLLHSSLFLGTEISTTTLANSKKSALFAEGYLSLNTTGTYEAILKGSNILNDITLEFPNKSVGSYTIATTTDIANKVDSNTAITGATKTKITYDSKGLVTSGADATTSDISDSLNKRYVTDANLTTIGNTSGTNTGDETVTTIKTKLGITTLSGSNTGDQDLSGLMVKSNNLSDLTNTTTARTNLGLGSLATQSGTFSGTSSGTNTGDQIISDATITTTDITTNNFTTAKHGFVPKGTNVGNYLKDDGTWGAISAGGLTYFTEAQSTASPNTTVNVDSLTAIASTTNADLALLPKGTGAFIVGHIPDGTGTGGNKRGAGAIEIQLGALDSNIGIASGVGSILIGSKNYAVGSNSIAIGTGCISVGANAIAIGTGNNIRADGANSLSIGQNGNLSNASGQFSVALLGGNSSNTGSFSAGNAISSGVNSLALAGTAYESAIASSTNSVAIGKGTLSNAPYSISLGNWSSSKSTASKLSLGSFIDTAPYLVGSTQLGLSSSLANTTTNTAIELSSQGGTAICLSLQNNEAIRVKGSIIGKQTASTNVACYDFDCIVVRGTTAGSTILPLSNVNLVLDTITLDTIPTLTANTTLGGLSVKSGAKTTTTIKWSCRIDSTEVILA